MSMRGRLDVSGDIPEQVDSWAMVSNMYAVTAAHQAVYTADRSTLGRAIGLCKPDALTGRSDIALPLARWAEAVLDDDIERALRALSVVASDDSPLVIGSIAPALGGTQAALERWDEVAHTADVMEAIWSTHPLVTPLPTSTVSLLRARIALASADRATAERCAHDALTVATDAGLHLISIDALETVGAVALLAGDPIRATRLAGAAHAERQRCGYVAQIWTGMTSTRTASLRGEHPDAWTEGMSLPFHEATSMAQRQRGPRGRPSFGYDSLTPTELLVAGHVADGRTNAETAASLLISVTTVKTHVTRIFTKLGVRNRAELAATVTRRDD
jgi:DNA-binding CsgD family transcriptional regulator